MVMCITQNPMTVSSQSFDAKRYVYLLFMLLLPFGKNTMDMHVSRIGRERNLMPILNSIATVSSTWNTVYSVELEIYLESSKAITASSLIFPDLIQFKIISDEEWILQCSKLPLLDLDIGSSV